MRNTDGYKNIFLPCTHTRKIITRRILTLRTIISIIHTHTLLSEINLQLYAHFMQRYHFYCNPLMGADRGLFLNGVLVQDYMMLGLDVTLHSRLEMRL